MMAKKYNSKFDTRKLTVCGLFSAAGIVVLFLASLIGIGIYAGPLVAAVAVVIVQCEYGSKAAFASYFVTAFIAVLLIPDRELAFIYVFFGWYPVVLPAMHKLKPKLLQYIAALVIYAAMLYLMYGVTMKLLGLDADTADESRALLTVLAVTGGAIFLLLDRIYTNFGRIWMRKYSKRIR